MVVKSKIMRDLILEREKKKLYYTENAKKFKEEIQDDSNIQDQSIKDSLLNDIDNVTKYIHKELEEEYIKKLANLLRSED